MMYRLTSAGKIIGEPGDFGLKKSGEKYLGDSNCVLRVTSMGASHTHLQTKRVLTEGNDAFSPQDPLIAEDPVCDQTFFDQDGIPRLLLFATLQHGRRESSQGAGLTTSSDTQRTDTCCD